MSEHFDCVYPGELLLPSSPVDFTSWACVACDQYTSQPKYWEDVELLVGARPSTFNIILPECWLDQAKARIPKIQQTMLSYLPLLTPAVQNGFVLTERSTGSGARLGLVATIDLERYDYRPDAQSLIRASEQTIESRIPPRLEVRRAAALETSHVILLMDDPMHSVVEPLFERADQLKKLYDFPLMMGGGHLSGYAVTAERDIQAVLDALGAICARQGENPLLFAVGDGNHSLAAAKANWEEIKRTLTPEQTAAHPARFAMVEIENIHDDALHFEPIHRVLFGCDGDTLLDEMEAFAAQAGVTLAAGVGAQTATIVFEGKEVVLGVEGSPYAMATGTLDAFLEPWLQKHPEARLDYVHGEDTVRTLVSGEQAVGFLMPKPDKNSFFDTIRREGRLPKKTFSMGEANEKRYYMEARRIRP